MKNLKLKSYDYDWKNGVEAVYKDVKSIILTKEKMLRIIYGKEYKVIEYYPICLELEFEEVKN